MATLRTKNKRKLVAEINVVPYIDVMLVLLIVKLIGVMGILLHVQQLVE